jgi:hypothetical protein
VNLTFPSLHLDSRDEDVRTTLDHKLEPVHYTYSVYTNILINQSPYLPLDEKSRCITLGLRTGTSRVGVSTTPSCPRLLLPARGTPPPNPREVGTGGAVEGAVKGV